MKNLYILFCLLLFITACDNDLDQVPPLDAEASSLTSYAEVLNAAYYYQQAAATPLVIMGDFRADNFLMAEEPYPAFDRFNPDLAGGDLVGQFFGPFYTNMYKAILSANNVIENSADATEVAEAQFLRGLSYFKLVKVFGDVTVNLSAAPSLDDRSILARTRAADVYTNVIIPDFQAAISALGNADLGFRATRIAAQGFLGKVYMHTGNFSGAATQLGEVVSGASGAGIELLPNFADIFAEGADLNAEIIFATQLSSSIDRGYSFTGFPGWFSGGDTKSLEPLDQDLVAAFAASGAEDVRGALTIGADEKTSPKWGGGLEQDAIELRLGDVILMYAEALNETSGDAAGELNKIRNRAGLPDTEAASQAELRQAIADERRLELACEGHRWFDLVRTGTVDAAIGQTVNPIYHVFPLPASEVLASDGVITQNPGY